MTTCGGQKRILVEQIRAAREGLRAKRNSVGAAPWSAGEVLDLCS